MKIKKENRGISLIVLVITVIILSILATTVIISVSNTNIISKASDTKASYEKAQVQEAASLAFAEAHFKSYNSDEERENYIMGLISESVANDELLSKYNIIITENEVKVEDKITNPYDENAWEFAYVSENGVWERITGGTAEGDVVAKFYKQDEIITDAEFEGIALPESNAYIAVIEGTGAMPALTDGDNAFAWYAELMNFFETEGQGSIGPLPYITEVIICDGITSVADACLVYGVSLRSVELPYSVTSIGEGAFGLCINLTSVDMPKVKVIGDRAFDTCSSLTSVNMPKVTNIGVSAFIRSGLVNIYLPNVTRIGDFAFADLGSLTSVTILSDFTWGEGVFGGCSSLTDVNMPNVTHVAWKGFQFCESLTSVSFPTLTYVDALAFGECTNLTSVSIPNVTAVGLRAFLGCTSLTDIYYGGSAEEWSNVEIEAENESLINATIHYNSK